MQERELSVGDKVCGGIGADYDVGKIISIDGDTATVAWDSGVRTSCPLADLSAVIGEGV